MAGRDRVVRRETRALRRSWPDGTFRLPFRLVQNVSPQETQIALLQEFMMRNFRIAVFLVVALAVFSRAQQAPQHAAPATGQQPCCDAFEERMRAMEDRVILLEGQVRLLKEQLGKTQTSQLQAPAELGAGASPSTGAATAAGASRVPAPAVAAADNQGTGAAPAVGQSNAPLPVYGGATALAKALNPDISAIGDFLGSAGHYPTPPGTVIRQAGFHSLEMHETELGFQAIVDPYARADFFLSFGEENVNLEEGYITFTALPAGFVAKVGKLRAVFGKVNTLHNHVLPWADRPLVTENLVGGEDGIDDAGVSIERILPAPGGFFLEATGQVFRGDTGSQTFFTPTGTTTQQLFTASGKSDVSTVAHLRGYKDITESTNLDLGVSYARGHNEFGSDFLTQLYGVDGTVRWKPLRRSIYHSFVGRTELIWSQRQQPPSSGGEQKAFGVYASADYQLGRRWFVGGRYDYSERARQANQLDRGASAVLTYWPSEFSQIRGQYRFTDYAGGIQAHELLMQVQFSLGAHGAHPF
jgi:hypothetical protein